jgi:hypothetical protein
MAREARAASMATVQLLAPSSSAALDRFIQHGCRQLKVKGETVCASLDGIPFEPCFDLNKTDDQSFRGSVSGLDFAYCDFTHRPDINGRTAHLRPSEPLSLNPMRYKRAK